jgi:hypothetical protein
MARTTIHSSLGKETSLLKYCQHITYATIGKWQAKETSQFNSKLWNYKVTTGPAASP